MELWQSRLCLVTNIFLCYAHFKMFDGYEAVQMAENTGKKVGKDKTGGMDLILKAFCRTLH